MHSPKIKSCFQDVQWCQQLRGLTVSCKHDICKSTCKSFFSPNLFHTSISHKIIDIMQAFVHKAAITAKQAPCSRSMEALLRFSAANVIQSGWLWLFAELELLRLGTSVSCLKLLPSPLSGCSGKGVSGCFGKRVSGCSGKGVSGWCSGSRSQHARKLSRILC